MRTTLIHRLPFCWLLGIRAVARGRWVPRGLPPETGCDQGDASCCVHLVWCHNINAHLYKIIISRVCSRCETPKKHTQFAFSNPSWGSDCDVVFVSSCKISRQLFKQPQRLGTPSGCHSWYMMKFLFVSQMSQILIEQANYLKIVNKQGTKPNNYLVALIPHRAFERDTSWWKMAQLPSEYGAWRRRRCSCVWRREGIHRRTKSWRMLGHVFCRHIVWTFSN